MDKTLEMFIYKKLLEESKGPGLCNKRNVYAALITKSSDIYYGQNGYKHDPCSAKGPNYCKREEGVTEYISCHSFCAEGTAMLNAIDLKSYELVDSVVDVLFNKKILKGSTLITTGFPCERCTSIIIDAGIDNVLFGSYKEGRPRPKDIYDTAQMTSSGIKLNRIVGCIGEHGIIEYILKEVDPGPDIESFVVGKARTSGEIFFRMSFDEWFRSQVRAMANARKIESQPVH